MTNPRRSTRNKNPPNFPEAMDALITFTNQRLTPKCKLEDFRVFFDFKVRPWKAFHRQLKEYVLLASTWAEIQENAAKREVFAATFLEQVGFEYWGKENQEKYLIQAHVRNGDVCVYPRDKKILTKAIAFLLEKDSKNRRESASQDVSETQRSPLSDPPALDSEMTAPMKQSNSRASSPIGLFRIPQSLQAPKTPQNPQITPSERSSSVMGAERTPVRPASTPPTPMSRAPLDTVESMDAVESSAMVSSAFAPRGTPSQEVTQYCCQGYVGISQTFFTQFSDIAPHTLATYFLVQEYGSQNAPVCVPFRNFEDYGTTDDFLDEMEKRCCCEHDPPLLQLFEGVRQFSYAVVLLQWSGVSFVMRRETDDLRSLANRIGCAWWAKEGGELQTFEFVIRVTLKKD